MTVAKVAATKGLILVFTGDGKGKTTAALGTVLRAIGHGFKVKVFHFIKSPRSYGEFKALQNLGVEDEALGRGFTWNSENIEHDRKLAQNGWEKARHDILSGDYDMVVLDEFTHALSLGFIDLEEAINVLRERPPDVHVIITGRDAPSKLIDVANLVTEMKMVKHPYHAEKLKAQKGIEF